VDDSLRRNLFAAARLLRRAHALPAEDPFGPAHQALRELETARTPEARAAVLDRLNQQVKTVMAALEAAVPVVAAYNAPNDDGREIDVCWRPVPGATSFVVRRLNLEDPQAEWETMGETGRTTYSYADKERIRAGRPFQYRVIAELKPADPNAPPEKIELGTTARVRATSEWINMTLAWFFLFMLILCGAVIYFIERAKRGAKLKIRKIAGLDAVDEAVGRATEMGRSIVFVLGIGGLSEIQTLAGLTILGRVAATAAEHDAAIQVPTIDPLVMTAARETIHAAYNNAGRPDSYDDKMSYYVTGDQFAYVASVTGTMMRERPAACFYMGSFYAESLILAESANVIGSIQIAGTAQPAQLPFFVAACDYVLIGEELFAASAYLSGEPQQLGSLKGQDVGKAIVMVVMVIGLILTSAVALWPLANTWVGDLLEFLRSDVLSVSIQ
jgi:hypothetical protein